MIVKDPCGIVCVLITYLAVFYADYVIIKWVVLQTMVDRYISITVMVLTLFVIY